MVDSTVSEALKNHIRTVIDYPKKGIVYRDITPLLGNAEAFFLAVEAMAKPFENKRIDKVAGIEARGFILGSALAGKLKAGFVPIRKAGKLPYQTIEASYALEYGEDRLQVHRDALEPKESVLLVDDLIATGGTALAAAHLIEQLKATIVGASFLIDLTFLEGSDKLAASGVTHYSVIQYGIE
jgi:adenine phosphoribosyltransferase